ncbi:hypothetical protein BT69DRAFT_1363669, partial [Atractiella rhizophila]
LEFVFFKKIKLGNTTYFAVSDIHHSEQHPIIETLTSLLVDIPDDFGGKSFDDLIVEATLASKLAGLNLQGASDVKPTLHCKGSKTMSGKSAAVDGMLDKQDWLGTAHWHAKWYDSMGVKRIDTIDDFPTWRNPLVPLDLAGIASVLRKVMYIPSKSAFSDEGIGGQPRVRLSG